MKQSVKILFATISILLFALSAFALESTLTLRGGVSGAETDIYANKQLNGMVGMGYEVWFAKWLSLGINPYVTRVQAGPENAPIIPNKVASINPPYNFKSNVVGGDLLFRLRPTWKYVAPYLTAGAGVVNYFPKTRGGDEIGGYPETFDYTSFAAPVVGVGLHIFTQRDIDFELGFQKNFLMTDYLEGWEKGEFNDNLWMAFLGVSHTFGKSKAAPVVIPQTIFNISPNTRNVNDKAGSTQFFIDANKAWTATENESWLTVSPVAGTGSANFIINYDANTDINPRTGYIYVTSDGITKTLTVTQEGYKPFINVTPSVQNVTGQAGTTTFKVDANIPWTVSEDVEWLTVSPIEGNNDGSFTVTYDANPTYIVKTGQINVSGNEVVQTVTVIQAGLPEITLKNVNFDFDKYDLTDTAIGRLNDNIVVLMANPAIKVEISGHTDFMGTERYNDKLSQNRAKAVKDYLVQNGIEAERLTIKALGETQPLSTNDTEEGRAQNRRAELAVVK